MTKEEELQALIGHQFTKPELLRTAITHRSYHFENKTRSPGHFERLEFLGDAVLDLLMSEALMNHYPYVDEGTLSKWRASLVNEASLSAKARALQLGRFLYLGRSEEQNREQSASRPRMLASVFEAIVAAIYLDGGLEAARKFVVGQFALDLAQLNVENEFATDFKTRLQEYAQKKFRCLPDYRLVQAEGPEHAKKFRYEVWVNGTRLGEGEGASRKTAEQAAASQALEHLTRGATP